MIWYAALRDYFLHAHPESGFMNAPSRDEESFQPTCCSPTSLKPACVYLQGALWHSGVQSCTYCTADTQYVNSLPLIIKISHKAWKHGGSEAAATSRWSLSKEWTEDMKHTQTSHTATNPQLWGKQSQKLQIAQVTSGDKWLLPDVVFKNWLW